VLAYLAAAALLAGIYALGYLVVAYFRPGGIVPLWINVLLVLALAAIFQPLTRSLDILITRRLDLISREQLEALADFSESSREVQTDPAQFTDSVLGLLSRVLQAQSVYLLLPAPDGAGLVLTRGSGLEHIPDPSQVRFGRAFTRALIDEGGFVYRQGEALPSHITMAGPTDLKCLNLLDARVVAPLVSAETFQGALLLGPKLNGEDYGMDDLRVLGIALRQLSVVMENSDLREDLKQARSGLKRAWEKLSQHDELKRWQDRSGRAAAHFGDLLQNITEMTQAALGQVQDPTLRARLQVIEQSAREGTGQVAFLHDDGTSPEAEQTVSINALAEASLNSLGPVLDELHNLRGVEIDIEVDYGDIGALRCRPDELCEAIAAILLNAVEAMPMGGRLYLGTRELEGHAAITVNDSGEGIQEDVIRHVFEPFYTSRGDSGAIGLGLSVALAIVKRHGGEITLTSRPGQGSTFTITLPLPRRKRAKQAPPEAVQVSQPSAETAPEAMHYRTVLILSEDTELARTLRAMLLESGYVSETANSAEAALALSQRQHYDAALVDTDLPAEAAWEAARTLVSWSGTANVIFLCRWDAAADLNRLMQAGISAVVLKPPLKEDVLAKVRRVIAQPWQSSPETD
jgi:signal transduction histidine kinase/ActR/RegA family two-component response regulator